MSRIDWRELQLSVERLYLGYLSCMSDLLVKFDDGRAGGGEVLHLWALV